MRVTLALVTVASALLGWWLAWPVTPPRVEWVGSAAGALAVPSRLSHYRVEFERQEDGTGDVVSLSGWVRETEIVVGRNKVDVTAVVEAGYGSVRNVTVRRLRRL